MLAEGLLIRVTWPVDGFALLIRGNVNKSFWCSIVSSIPSLAKLFGLRVVLELLLPSLLVLHKCKRELRTLLHAGHALGAPLSFRRNNS